MAHGSHSRASNALRSISSSSRAGVDCSCSTHSSAYRVASDWVMVPGRCLKCGSVVSLNRWLYQMVVFDVHVNLSRSDPACGVGPVTGLFVVGLGDDRGPRNAYGS
uniref:Uncharacterized protein n=1 Tax=Haptolina ericina TaxID=156174 RepID=A0A7S3ADU9_9EUKA